MSLKREGLTINMRHLCFILIIALSMTLVGCGGTEEATQEQAQGQQAVQAPAPAQQQKPEEKKSESDQALTSFIGDKEPEAAAETSKASTQPTQPQLSQYEKQIQDLRTENTSLKQKMMKIEQENRDLTSRLSDSDAKLTTETSRADRAEALNKNLPMPPVPSTNAAVAQPPREAMQPKPVVDETKTNFSMSAYEDGLKSFNTRKYDAAIRSFQDLLNGGVAEDMRDNCVYWIGESHFAQKKYSEALKNFQDVLTMKNSEKKADAQFMVAQTYERLGNKKKAKEAYERVVKDYPMSKNIKHSKERWAKL